MTIEKIFTPQDDAFYAVITRGGAAGRAAADPADADGIPSGNLFGMTQNAGMGWDANKLTGKEVLIIGTRGGIRAGDGRPVALGYHTGHWEIGMQMQAAARITRNGGIPLRPSSAIRATGARRARTACSTPCRIVTTRRLCFAV